MAGKHIRVTSYSQPPEQASGTLNIGEEEGKGLHKQSVRNQPSRCLRPAPYLDRAPVGPRRRPAEPVEFWSAPSVSPTVRGMLLGVVTPKVQATAWCRARDRPAGLRGGVVVSANGTGDGASAALRQPAARRKFWGWGLEGEGLAEGEIGQLGAVFTERLGIDSVRAQEPPRVQELDLPMPRLVPPASLEPVFST